MHECTQKELIDNIRTKLKEEICNIRHEQKELEKEVQELKTRTELQEFSIKGIKEDVKTIRSDMKEVKETLSNSKNLIIGTLVGLCLNLAAVIVAIALGVN